MYPRHLSEDNLELLLSLVNDWYIEAQGGKPYIARAVEAKRSSTAHRHNRLPRQDTWVPCATKALVKSS
jgi:hypothetical protein